MIKIDFIKKRNQILKIIQNRKTLTFQQYLVENLQHPYVHNSCRKFVMVERNSKMTDKKSKKMSKKMSKKKDGRKQKGEKSSELKQRIKKYKSEQQRKKKGKKPKKY